MNGIKLIVFATLLMAGIVVVADESQGYSEARQVNIARCATRFSENKEAFADEARYLVARGVVADKHTRTVTLDAFTTGVTPNDIAEFFLITENSGHDYEALFMTFATSDAICQAIEFIGVPRGRGVNYDALTFWPKGERLHATAAVGDAAPVPLETFVTFSETGSVLQPNGFVYVGDRRNDDGMFIGDEYGPGSVISSYNEPITVLDVPRKAEQAEVYEKYRVSTNVVSQVDVWTKIVLVPEKRPEESPMRVRDVTVMFSPEGVSLNGDEVAPFTTALASFQALIASQHDVYITLRWADALSLSQISEFSRVLALLDVDTGIRVEPPESGDPYYQAFMPQEGWRERKNRFSQPCELRFDADGVATVVAIEEQWLDDAIKPELSIEEIPAVTAETLLGVIQEKKADLPVLLIFAPGSLTVGQLRPYIRAVIETHPNIHVFVD